jgi:hypothetical protein
VYPYYVANILHTFGRRGAKSAYQTALRSARRARTESRAAVSTNVSSLPEISGMMGMKEIGRRTEVTNLLSQASLQFPVDVGTLFSFLPVENRHGVVLRFNSRCN